MILFGIRRTGTMVLPLLLLPIMIAAQSSTAGRFGPFDRALNGLGELHYVQQSAGLPQQGQIKRINEQQAAKALRSADPALSLEHTEVVQELIQYYLQPANRHHVEIMLGLAESYIPLFESFLLEEGLPADLKYLPMALSALNTRAVSQWGASGLWQIMYTNGRLYKLQIDSYVDERRDPVQSTRAAILHLKDLYGIYQNWELAIAAYTNSPSNVNKAIRKAGGSRKYADIYPWLPVETRDYLPAYAACFIMMQQYELVGFKPFKITNPLQHMRASVSNRLHLGQVADVLNVPLQMLLDMNPEFRSGVVPAGNSRVYWIKLPAEHHDQFTLHADSIHRYRDTLYFPARHALIYSDVSPQIQDEAEQGDHDENIEPAVTPPPAQPVTPSVPAGRTKLSYTVKDGDNLGYISGWYDVRVSDIRSWNGLSGDVIRVGQVLDIWVPEGRVSKYREIDRMTFAEKQRGATTASRSSTASTRQPSSAASGSFTWYTIKQGETLSAIAARYPGVTADEIMRLNNIRNPRSLQVGQRIKIPEK